MLEGGRTLASALITFLVVILILYLINLLPLDGRAKQIGARRSGSSRRDSRSPKYIAVI